jgi:hypothetical protein
VNIETTGPELVMHHYTEAKQPERAIPVLAEGGRPGARAYGAHRGDLELVAALPPSAERDATAWGGEDDLHPAPGGGPLPPSWNLLSRLRPISAREGPKPSSDGLRSVVLAFGGRDDLDLGLRSVVLVSLPETTRTRCAPTSRRPRGPRTKPRARKPTNGNFRKRGMAGIAVQVRKMRT